MSLDVFRWLEQLARLGHGLDREHWVILSFAVLGLGAMCLRGFGGQLK